MLYALIIVLGVALDQITKQIITSNLLFGESFSVIPNFFYITHWVNTGAAFGMMQDRRIFLLIATLIAFLLLIYFFKNTPVKIFRYSIVIVIAGAIGNLIDRLFRGGGVIDFLLFKFGEYNFPAFNVADILIVCGGSLLFITVMFDSRFKK